MSEVIKGTSAISLNGELTDREAARVERLLMRMGFEVSRNEPGCLDEGVGSLMAKRPDVIEEAGFKNAVVEIGEETRYYAGVAWGALLRCYRMAHPLFRHEEVTPYDDFPAEFLPTGFGEPRLLVAESVFPSVGWAYGHLDLHGINERLALAWDAVWHAYKHQGMAINPSYENPYPVHLRT